MYIPKKYFGQKTPFYMDYFYIPVCLREIEVEENTI